MVPRSRLGDLDRIDIDHAIGVLGPLAHSGALLRL
jgi:hypothetical protein